MDLFGLVAILANKDSCKEWLRQKGLLVIPGSELRCAKCSGHFKEVKRSRRSDDTKLRCYGCKRERSIRISSFFSNSHLDLRLLVCLLFMFSHHAPVGFVETILNQSITRKAVIDWFTFYRDICSRWLWSHPLQLGGPGCIVEINESIFKGAKRKRNGEHTSPSQLVFGAWDRRLGKGMLWRVPDKEQDTLLPIIKGHILPGSIIYSNSSPAYSTLHEEGYHHEVAKGGRGFSTQNDSGVTIHINSIRGWWANIKCDLKRMKGVKEEKLPHYLDELMYRQHRGNSDLMDSMIEDIAHFYPVATEIE